MSSPCDVCRLGLQPISPVGPQRQRPGGAQDPPRRMVQDWHRYRRGVGGGNAAPCSAAERHGRVTKPKRTPYRYVTSTSPHCTCSCLPWDWERSERSPLAPISYGDLLPVDSVTLYPRFRFRLRNGPPVSGMRMKPAEVCGIRGMRMMYYTVVQPRSPLPALRTGRACTDACAGPRCGRDRVTVRL